MRAQAASLPYTPVFACLVAIVNSKLPAIGELLIHRLVVQFRRAYKRNDKPTCIATLTFLAHLCNQRVLAELIAMEVLQLLLDGPTDDSVELAVGFTREVGLLLQETAPKFNNALYEMYRDVLHSPRIDKRVQYMVEVLFQVRKDKFKDNPVLPEGLDLVEDGDLITHRISLTDQVAVQDGLNIFHTDAEFEQHEAEYKQMRDEILGSDDGESGSDAGSESSDDDGEAAAGGEDLTGTIDIHDQTETNLVNLRRQIYLTIMSALDFQEAIHKLLKIELAPGQEVRSRPGLPCYL
jgi:pre-mRNA-splicing factor CWC22